MSTTINTIKLASREGEIYISQQQLAEYKNIKLFGHGYLDWTTVINQAIVDLIDKIDQMEDGGVSEFQFDLEQYQEQEKGLREKEFAYWKQELIRELRDMVSGIQLGDEINNFISDQANINQSLISGLSQVNTELGQIGQTLTQNLEQQINDILTSKLGAVYNTVNNLVATVNDTVSAVNANVNDMADYKVVVNNSIQQTKTELVQSITSIDQSLRDLISTVKADLENEIANAALTGSGGLGAAELLRIEELEEAMLELTPNKLEAKIDDTVQEKLNNSITTYVNGINNSINNLAEEIQTVSNNIESQISQKITEAIGPIAQDLNNAQNIMAEMTQLVDIIQNSAVASAEFVQEFKNMVENSTFGTLGELFLIFDSIGATHIAANATRFQLANMITRLMNALSEQKRDDTKRLLDIFHSDMMRISLASRDSGFNELALLYPNEIEKQKYNDLQFEKFQYNNINNPEFGPVAVEFMFGEPDLQSATMVLRIPQDIIKINKPATFKITILDENEQPIEIEGSPYSYRTIIAKSKYTHSYWQGSGVYRELADGESKASDVIGPMEESNISSNMELIVYDELTGLTFPFTVDLRIYVNYIIERNPNMNVQALSMRFQIIKYDSSVVLESFSMKISDLYRNAPGTKSLDDFLNIDELTDYLTSLKNLPTIVSDTKVVDTAIISTPYSTLVYNSNITMPVNEIIKSGSNYFWRFKINFPQGFVLTNIKLQKGTDSGYSAEETLEAENITTFNVSQTLQRATSKPIMYFTPLASTSLQQISIGVNDRLKGTITYKNASGTTLTQTFTCDSRDPFEIIDQLQTEGMPASKLATSRTIGGVGFDGTANINLPGVNAQGNQNTTGNAATATKLATPRTISGVAFDGTKNIDLGLGDFTKNNEFDQKSTNFIQNYLPSGLKGELPFIKNNASNVFEMDSFLKIGHFVNGPEQLNATKGFVKSFQEIFNTWKRFSHIHSNEAQPASASDMAAWQYNVASGSIVQPNNTPTLTGFVSDELIEDYNHEVILRSTQTDDDAIGIVVAFTTDENGREHHLTVYVRKNIGNHYAGTSVQDPNTHYALCYNYHRSDNKLLVDGSSTTDLGPFVTAAQGGWSKYPLGIRVRVERRGDIIKVWRSAWSTTSNALVPSTLLELDLKSDPVLAKFRGKSKYGYFALSQGGATFEIVEGVKTFESIIFDLTTGNIQEFKNGTWQVTSNEKIQNYVSPGRLLYNKHLGKLFYYIGDVGTTPTVLPIELK